MSRDIDYGCNANDPENVIATILDNARTARVIMEELEGLGFKIIRVSDVPQTQRTCATCHAVLADGPQPAATYEPQPQEALEQWESEWPDRPAGWEDSEARLRLQEIIRPQCVPEPAVWRILCTTNGATGYLYTEVLPFNPGLGVNVRREPEPLYAALSRPERCGGAV